MLKVLISENQLRRIVEVSGGSNKLPQDEFISRSQKIHTKEDGSPKYDYSLVDFQGTGKKVKIVCPEHSQEQMNLSGVPYFEVWPNKHLQGQNKCPFESLRKETKHTDQELADVALNVSNTTEFESKFPSEYYAARKRDKTNPGFYSKITSHFESIARESYGEQEVSKILDEFGISYERGKNFEDCTNLRTGRGCRSLPFDFYIPELNTVIEYDGEQHFTPSNLYGMNKFLATQNNDKLKNEYCKQNGIKLIRLHYKLKDLNSAVKEGLNSKKTIFLGPY